MTLLDIGHLHFEFIRFFFFLNLFKDFVIKNMVNNVTDNRLLKSEGCLFNVVVVAACCLYLCLHVLVDFFPLWY